MTESQALLWAAYHIAAAVRTADNRWMCAHCRSEPSKTAKDLRHTDDCGFMAFSGAVRMVLESTKAAMLLAVRDSIPQQLAGFADRKMSEDLR